MVSHGAGNNIHGDRSGSISAHSQRCKSSWVGQRVGVWRHPLKNPSSQWEAERDRCLPENAPEDWDGPSAQFRFGHVWSGSSRVVSLPLYETISIPPQSYGKRPPCLPFAQISLLIVVCLSGIDKSFKRPQPPCTSSFSTGHTNVGSDLILSPACLFNLLPYLCSTSSQVRTI